MKRPSQTRIVLAQKHIPLADQILEQTGIATYSQLTAILLVNYGTHLMKALNQQGTER